jgi:hypothetical protein
MKVVRFSFVLSFFKYNTYDNQGEMMSQQEWNDVVKSGAKKNWTTMHRFEFEKKNQMLNYFKRNFPFLFYTTLKFIWQQCNVESRYVG